MSNIEYSSNKGQHYINKYINNKSDIIKSENQSKLMLFINFI